MSTQFVIFALGGIFLLIGLLKSGFDIRGHKIPQIFGVVRLLSVVCGTVIILIGFNISILSPNSSFSSSPLVLPPLLADAAEISQASSTGIQIVEATYGGNCHVSSGNVSRHIASVCNGNTSCTYTIDYTVIGDPAYGCKKDYSTRWKCGVNKSIYSAYADPEAGYQKTIQLNCPVNCSQ
ncbi:hypothetical protein H1Q63_36235 [Desmonostoc muscorum CCALA 125]|nr:hypothetical protein [Desmonostoc muscorum CCALA 125]